MKEQFHTKLAGVTQVNEVGGIKLSRQTIIRRCVTLDQALLLKREPQNRFDKNTIAVYACPREDPWHQGKYQIGYLTREVAAELAPLMDGGHTVNCIVADVTGGEGEKETVGVNILLTIFSPAEISERRRKRQALQHNGTQQAARINNAKSSSRISWKEILLMIIIGIQKIWNSGKTGKMTLGCGSFLLLSLLCGFLGVLFPSQESSDDIEKETLAAFVTQLAQASVAQTPISMINDETPATVDNLSAVNSVALDVPVFTPTTEIQIPDNPEMACIPRENKREIGIVSQVVDGDTIHVVIDGYDYPVRYIGMDTPENTNEIEYYGQESSDFNGQLVEGKTVILVKDESETDIYDRLLRYVVVDNVFVNYELVKNSYAYAKSYPPDTACDQIFAEAQNQASVLGMGLWIPQPTLTPTQVVAPVVNSSSCPNGCTEQLPGCDIKGNINSEGEKIYHVPGSTSYSKTKIDPSDGERWFCTVDEATNNGWRAPRN